VAALRAHPACKGKVAAVGFCLGGRLAVMAAAGGHIDCAVSYYGVNIDRVLPELPPITIPLVLHFGDDDALVSPQARATIKQHFQGRDDVEIYGYPCVGHGFVNPVRPAYHKPSADMAYTRTLALLRKVMGPHYDLSALWEVHRSHEFVTRDADETMKTMVDEPYVNHIPTLTGGHGQRELHRFYKHHFIPRSPKDMRNIPISRTIGVDRIVNEGVLCFTHDIEIDWMLPGLKPTGRYVEVPLVGVVTFRGDKLVHEHIYWDQASVLVQLGLLDPTGLPVAGIASAKKVLDPRLPANELMPNWSDSGPTA
jgi:carboxymethylenebutenolidase